MKKYFCFLLVILSLTFTGCDSTGKNIKFQEYKEVTGITDEVSAIDENSTAGDYIRYAFKNNPELIASHQRYEAAFEKISQMKFPENPSLNYEYALDEKDFIYRINFLQVLPGFGKLKLNSKQAVRETEVAFYEFEAAKVMLYGKIIKAYYDYCYLERAIVATGENEKLLTVLENSIETKYKSGTSQFSDLIRIQIETERLRNDLATLNDERKAQSANLTALLNYPQDEILPWPKPEISLKNNLPHSDLMSLIQNNPEYKAKKALAEKEEISVRLAKKNRYPDFMLGASWMVMPAMEGDGEETDIGLMAGVELPVWQGKYSSEIKESLSLHSAALNDLKNTENKIKAELQMALFKSNDAQRRITLFRDSLIPKATQAFEVAKEDFSSGKGDFMNLIDAERTFLEFKLLYERAKADNEIACGEIAILINDPFYEKTVNKLM